MNIALPDDMKKFVEAEVKAGSYSSSSEFVRALIRSYREKRQSEKLDAMLLKSLQSKKTPLTMADFEKFRAEVARRDSKN